MRSWHGREDEDLFDNPPDWALRLWDWILRIFGGRK